MKPIEGALIVAHGQGVRITQVITVDGRSRIYLEHPIVVPGEEYTRDYIDTREIERYVGV